MKLTILENYSIGNIVRSVFEKVFKPLVPYSPYSKKMTRSDGTTYIRRSSTGNMRYNASKIIEINSTRYQLVVDDNIAPYVMFTDKPWTANKWKGAKNPNENWFNNAVNEFIDALTKELNGKIEITKGDTSDD